MHVYVLDPYWNGNVKRESDIIIKSIPPKRDLAEVLQKS